MSLALVAMLLLVGGHRDGAWVESQPGVRTIEVPVLGELRVVPDAELPVSGVLADLLEEARQDQPPPLVYHLRTVHLGSEARDFYLLDGEEWPETQAVWNRIVAGPPT